MGTHLDVMGKKYAEYIDFKKKCSIWSKFWERMFSFEAGKKRLCSVLIVEFE